MNVPARRARSQGTGGRCDVLGFPANTTILLVLLGMATVTITLYVNVVMSGPAVPRCAEDIPGLTTGTFTSKAEVVCVKASLRAMGEHALKRTWVPLALGALMYVAAASLRLRTLRPLEAPYAPQRRRIAELAAKLPLPRRPLIFGARHGREVTCVGGSPRRPYIRVSNNHLAWYTLDDQRRAGFDAIILHELAHLDGGDLRTHQAARAMRKLALAYCFFALLTVPAFTGVQAWVLSGQLVLIAVVIELIVRAFLRARELRADAFAAAHAPDGMSYSVELAAQGQQPRRGRSALLARHPEAARRLAVLRDPASILRFRLSHALGSGFLGGLAVSVLGTVVGYLYWGPGGKAGEETGAAALVVGVPVAVVFCLGMLRHSWGELLGSAHPRTSLLVTSMAGGLVAGHYASPFFSVFADTGAASAALPIALFSWLIAIVAVRWPVAVAHGWFPAEAEGGDRRAAADGHSRVFRLMKWFAVAVGCLVYFRLLAAWGLFARLAESVAAHATNLPTGLPPRLDLEGLRQIALLVMESAAGGLVPVMALTLAWALPLAPRVLSPFHAPAARAQWFGRRARRSAVLWTLTTFIAGLLGMPATDGLRIWAGLGTPLPQRVALLVGAMVVTAVVTTIRVPGPLAGPYAMAAACTAALTGIALLSCTDSGRRGLPDALPHLLAGGQLLAGLATVAVGGTKRVLGRAARTALAGVLKDAESNGALPAAAAPNSRSYDPVLLTKAVRRALEQSGPFKDSALAGHRAAAPGLQAAGAAAQAGLPDPVPLTDTVGRALGLAAARQDTQVRSLSTQDLLIALMECDDAAEWDRIWLHTRPLEHLRAHPVPDTGAEARLRHGYSVTVSCASALDTAARLARHCALPLTSGVLTLALVADAGAGAGRALGVGSDVSRADLLELVQECVHGATIEDLPRLLEAAGPTDGRPRENTAEQGRDGRSFGEGG